MDRCRLTYFGKSEKVCRVLKIWTDLSMAYVLLRVNHGGEALVLAQKIWPESVSALELYATSIYCSNLTGQSNNNIVNK